MVPLRSIKGIPFYVVATGTKVVDAVSGKTHVVGPDSVIIGPTKIVLGINAEPRMRQILKGAENGDEDQQ